MLKSPRVRTGLGFRVWGLGIKGFGVGGLGFSGEVRLCVQFPIPRLRFRVYPGPSDYNLQDDWEVVSLAAASAPVAAT